MPRRSRIPRTPRAHWLLLGLVLLVLCGLLGLDSVLSRAGAPSTPSGSRQFVPESAFAGGSVIDPREPVVQHPPDRHLALTFADGPDPQWTPVLLDVLARHQVHATFFVTGAQAAENQALVRRIVDAGHEIGNRTLTRTDLRQAGDLRVQLELQATDLVLASAAGITTDLVQPPYATTGSLDYDAWKAFLRIGNHGRQVVLADLDSQDWRQPDAAAVLANSTPRDDRGAVLMMSGTAGPATVEALDRLLPGLQRSGWQVDSVGGTFQLPGTMNEAGIVDRIAGTLLATTIWSSARLSDALRVLLLAATVLVALRGVFVLLVVPIHVRRSRRWEPPWQISQRVGVIVPAYNEEAGIANTVRSILASEHPVEVIVVDDGSTDRTVEVVERLQERFPRIRLVRQENSGKAVALNTGLTAANSELVVMVDGDTVLEPDAVGRMVAHFTDPAIGAVSGNVKVGNRRSLLGRWQHIEYVIGFNLDRRVYDVLHCTPTAPGALGAFRRSAILEIGGVSDDTLAEDTDLTMALERAGWRVVYEQNAISWTEAPATYGQLWKQRYRWCYGTLQAIWKHRRAVVERGAAGRLGRRGLPYLLVFQVLLQVISPVVDVTACFALFTEDAGEVALTWLGFLVLQAVPGVIAFRLDGEPLRPLLVLPLQQIVYRQLMYLVVVQSVITALAGARLPWQKLERRGRIVPLAAGRRR
ncbi:bifunctional polysaccharide deacetylase/glycosyltransferase family 2 protein [Saccharopolyspora elongata]|uniref:Glycosyltransferase n=1 Tax=Saccharopolyspora elongata TaxID=2530387 RepID=A0A4R4Y6G1_9PSEU|nr:bifunctional polysaccharide deacetylase/glycosyltransferase family 2 protein [Saccharopolyspora elongata]TDD38572.1 glycosyltransferase [Saccharopolyspora elongata]